MGPEGDRARSSCNVRHVAPAEMGCEIRPEEAGEMVRADRRPVRPAEMSEQSAAEERGHEVSGGKTWLTLAAGPGNGLG